MDMFNDLFKIAAVADDAGNRAVQKTHPENQITPGLAAAMDNLEEFWRKNGIDPLDCSGPAEGHNTAQAPDGR